MKKFLLVMVVAILALALVACSGETTTTETTTTEVTTTEGGETTTTVAGDTSTTPESSEQTPGESSSDDDNGDQTPDEDEPIDLIWDDDYYCLSPIGNSYCSFEQGYGFDGPALVLCFTAAGGVYNDLVLIDPENADNETNWTMNTMYIWEVTVEGKVIEVTGNENFALFNNGTSGWIRVDLGETFSYSNYEYTTYDGYDGLVHPYSITLRILDSNKKPVYVAELADETFGEYYHPLPASTDVIAATRNPNYTLITDPVTPISGPSSSVGEGYANLFDGKTTSKVCTNYNDAAGTIVWSYTTAKTVMAFSIVNANDNDISTGRTIVAFTLQGSNDQNTWVDLLVEDGLNDDGSAIDKAAISANYLERYYEITTDENNAFTYFRFVPANGEMWQASEFYLYE